MSVYSSRKGITCSYTCAQNMAPLSLWKSFCGNYSVALLRACVENAAGPPGSWTEEQVIEGGKRERETLAYVWAKKRTGTRLVNAESTSGARDRAKDMNICIFMNKYRARKRLQPIRPAKQMSMHVRLHVQGTRWRYCRKHTGVPRSSTSLPKTSKRRKLWRRDGGEAFGFGLTALCPL